MTLTVEDIEALKRKRTPLKAKLTKFINFIDNNANKTKITEIKMRLEGLAGILDQFEAIQLEVDAATKTTGKEFDEYEKLYNETISRAVDLIQVSGSTQQITNQGVSNQFSNSNQRTHLSNQVKLPRIELTTFDGSYDKWLDFYNSFVSMVHDNQELSKVQKLFYLKSCLKEEAVTTIDALEISEDNYQIAWNLLTERYNNKRVIAQKHVKTLMEMPSISKESASELRKLLDTVRSHLRSLKSLGEQVDHWDTLLIYVITAKIDRNTHREWEKSITTSDMPKMKTFLEFLEQRCQILQVTSINVTSNNSNQTNASGKAQNNTQKRQSLTATKKSVSCLICKEAHKIYECEKFKNMNTKERADVIKENRVCFNCFNSGHRNNECKWSGCRKCGRKHNTLLHYENYNTNENSEENKSESVQLTSNSKLVAATTRLVSSQVLLSTALIDIKDKSGKMIQARVLLDNGSQSHFITEKFANLLNLPRQNVEIPVESLNQLETRIKESIKAEIFSKKRNYKERVDFLIIPRICDNLPNEFVEKNSLNIPQNIQLADPEFFKPKEIDALLGVEIFYNLLCIGQIDIVGQKAKLQKTRLGWIVSGKILSGNSTNKSKRCMFAQTSQSALQKYMTKFWEIEELQDRTFLSEEEFKVEEHFKQNTKRDVTTGQYKVKLPLNEKIAKLGESRRLAERQFFALERKFEKNPNLKHEYVKNMREAIELKHMIKIEPHEIAEKHCFLPHHPIIKEDSCSTRVRIVCNPSAKTTTGVSLNDCLMVGANVQSSSIDILFRFRTHEIVLLADIEKMFKQVRLDDDDINYQLILWRENSNHELQVFAIPVVLFGSAAAPFLATRVLNQLAEDERLNFPIASKILREDTYVDDVNTGTDNVQDAAILRDELIGITKAGGFNLRKWSSNNAEVIEPLPNDLTHVSLLADSNDKEVKALGIQWNKESDEITYKVKDDEFNLKITKRSVLSNIARLYDPIGLLGPVIVVAKIRMQAIWQCNIEWDEALPQNIFTRWNEVKEQLSMLNGVKFDRKVIIKDNAGVQIHGFCDASEKAYGACIYIRSIDNNGTVLTNLMCSKNRVAPLKTISLPKLELCAALLLSQLVKVVLNAIRVKIDDVFLWSDSSITLQWINTQPSSLKTFVANRVSEIRDTTNTMQWRYTPSQENAADILSRGQLPAEFLENTQWKLGPDWLREDSSQ